MPLNLPVHAFLERHLRRPTEQFGCAFDKPAGSLNVAGLGSEQAISEIAADKSCNASHECMHDRHCSGLSARGLLMDVSEKAI